MPTQQYENDQRQTTRSIVRLAIMSVIVTGLIVMAVLSTQACSV
jgi:hypothetical protein